MLMHNLAVQLNKTNILIFHPKLKAFLFRSSVFNIITEMIFFYNCMFGNRYFFSLYHSAESQSYL